MRVPHFSRICGLLLLSLLCLPVMGQVRKISSAPQGFVTGEGAFSAFMSALDAGQTTGLQIIGDSTGNDGNEWVYLTTAWLAAQYPGHSVKYRLWSDATQWYGATATVQTGTAGERYLNFTGTNGARIAASDIPEFTGDLDVRIKVAADSYRVAQCFVARYGAAGTRVFRILQIANGQVGYQWSTDGTALSSVTYSTVALPDSAGATLWLRVVHDLDNGAAGNDLKFYTSEDGATWTQLGTTVTTATATSLYASSTADWEIGSRGNGTPSEPFAGKVYAVEIMSGIDGYPVNPLPIDSWAPYDTTGTFVGAPELWVINGSHPGAGISYLDDATRRPKLMPKYGQTATVVSVSHNESRRIGEAQLSSYSTLLTNVKARLTTSSLVAVTQNPRTAPAANVREHAIRQAQIAGWARANGVSVVDVYRAFNLSPLGLAALVNSADGIHPTVAGSQLWAATVERAMTYSH